MSKKNKSEIESKERLEYLTKIFSSASTWDDTWRNNAEGWYDYYHGRQWTDDEIAALTERGQAVTTYNSIKPAIDSLLGSERQNRPKVSMAGRTLDDGKLAEAKTKLYDYIQYNSNTDEEIDKCARDSYITGRGWLYVYADTTGEHADLMHTFVDYRDMFVDSMSKKDDLSDCRYLHYAVFTDSDIIKSRFPEFREETGDTAILSFESSSDDKVVWYQDQDRKRPRLINSWWRDEDGDIHTAIWVNGQILYYKKNPYEMNLFPFVQYTLERDLDNMPYGLVRNMISAQDEVNKRHSKALHYLNARQVLAEEDAFEDWEEARKTLAKPDGITKIADGALREGKIEILDNTALANVHIQMMQIAKDNILYSAGLNPAYVGQSGQYDSAKKANISIAQAQNSIVPLLNKLRAARHRLAEITMKLVPEFYVEQRIIRIIQPNGEYAFMPLNKVQLLDDNTMVKMNDVTNDDVDVVIEDAPMGLNEREEQFAQLLQIQGQTGRPIPMEILLRYSSMKEKYQLAKDIEQHYNMEGQLQQAQQFIEQLQEQIKQLGGQVAQQQNQIVQERTARKVDKEVQKNINTMGLGLGV